MLDLLVRYAHDKRLVVEPGFAPKTVRFTLMFSASGQFLDVLSHQPPFSFERAPEMSFSELKALKGTGAHFLIETAQVVALYTGTNEADEDREKVEGKHRFFVRMLRDAASALPELAVIAETLDNLDRLAEIQRRLAEAKARPTDKVTFAIEGQYPVDSDAWHDWWRTFKRSIRGDAAPSGEAETDLMICFATGERVRPAITHPKIQGLSDVGGMGVGSPLIGYDKDAFLSYGLQQSANGTVSEEAASAYRAALNHLIAHHSQRLAGTKIVYWYSHTDKSENDPLAWLWQGEELNKIEKNAALIEAGKELGSIRTGERGEMGERMYYALTLSGAAGRVMVRDWITGQFDDLSHAVEQWFADLAIVRREGGALAPRPKFFAVLGATVRELSEIPSPHIAQMWRVAVQNLPIPGQIMALALNRLKLDIINNNGFAHARLGLLRAYHTRQGDSQLEPYLNPDHPAVAYHCGRLMAVFAALQRTALGDVGAGVIQRFYAAASATPALVLARLTRTSQFHLGKIQQQNPGLAFWFETRIAEIMSRIQDHIPSTLTLEQQSLFALGYYQQIAADRSPKTNTVIAANADNDQELNPEA
jgi:CRISPR-associated protein Csd1